MPTRKQLENMATAFARRNQVDPTLFKSLVTTESNWDPNARSGAGAVGLTQVVPRWHPDADLSTPKSQLEYGARHFGELLRKYGNPEDALSVYNSGRPWAEGKSIPETQAYVTKILNGRMSSPSAMRQAGAPVRQDSVAAERAAAVNEQLAAMRPSLAQELTQGLLSGNQSAGLLGAVGRYTTKKKEYQKQAAAVKQQMSEWGADPGAGAGSAAADFIGNEADPSDSQAVNAAKSQLGVPYSWGGGGTGGKSRGFGRGANTIGFDCSSLVQYAWAKQGVQLPRTTYDQIHVGQAVPSLADAKPGDLLFPNEGHVQLYLGGGRVIEAPRTGGRVQIVPVRDQYMAIRRPA